MADDVASPASSHPQGGQRVDLLGGMSESIFAAAAPAMVALGWSVFPQETTGERRMPGRVHGRTIRWSEDHDLANRLPTREFLRDCVLQCAGLNVACVFGPASGNTFAVDVDVMDERMVEDIVGLAEEILGETPFMRVGRAPKIAMIYRHGPGPDDVVASTSRFFARVDAEGNAERSGDGLEILGATKLITFHGRHHKTGNYFKWLKDNPLVDGPERAPLVTPDQVATFLEAVDARYRFHRGAAYSAPAASWQWNEETRMRVPRLSTAAGGVPWVMDDEGLVVDGRDSFLNRLVFQTLSGNATALDAAVQAGRDAVTRYKAEAAKAIADSFRSQARMDRSGRWSGNGLDREVQGRVTHLVSKHVAGRVKLREPRPQFDEAVPAMALPEPGEPLADPDLAFLRSHGERKARLSKGRPTKDLVRGFLEQPPEGAPDLSIPMDRGPIARMVQDGLRGAFDAFLADVYAPAVRADGGARPVRLHVLKAPTGAGKTSRCIRTLAEDPRTYEEHAWIDPDTGETVTGRAPFVMLLPTYDNISELRTRADVLRLDGSLPDDALRAQAAGLGLIQADELDAKVAELRRDALGLDLRTMVYSGKIRAGCRVKDKVELAMEAGIGTAAFCRAKVRKKDPAAGKDDPGTIEEVVCPFYQGCPAIDQRTAIQDAHLVFMPHSFLSLSIPEELETARAVIADERVHHLFLHTATFSASSLSIPRKPPRMTAKEKADGQRPDDLLAERDAAAWIALDAMRQRDGCPARALLEWRPDGTAADAGSPGLGLVRSALRVCGSAIQRDGTLSPDTPIEEVRALCARPTGRDLREEWQFWKIVEERLLALRDDAFRDEALRRGEKALESFQGQWEPARREAKERSLERIRAIPSRARGDRDHRIQHLTEASANGDVKEVVRISWRTSPNWRGVPLLLLDASAAPPIVAKIWGMREADIVVHDIVEDTGRALNVKIVGVVNQTFSNSSLVASPEATEFERLEAARNLAKVRQAISTVSAMYGRGRVVAGTSIVLREAINRDWACPSNVDWCHYGAMRGLDGFKFHAAAISVGRMEPPTRTIDGLVAALAYDDEVPEAPFDARGDGKDPRDGVTDIRLPSGEQRLRLRSGHTAVLKVPMFEGRWARLVQRQYREEELMQFVGRLRPVYREGQPPVWFALSSVIPEELIVDDLVHIDDLLNARGRFWDAVRVSGGVVDPAEIAAADPDRYRKQGSAAREMAALGFDPSAGDEVARAASGFARVGWSLDDGTEGTAWVRASLPSPGEVLRERLDARHPGRAVSVRVEWSPAEDICAMARAREPDGVEKRIGPSDGRRDKETACLDRVGLRLLDEPGEILEIGSNRTFHLFGKEVTVPEVAALEALDRFWKARMGLEDDRILPLLPDAPSGAERDGTERGTYAHLGATVRDEGVLAA